MDSDLDQWIKDALLEGERNLDLPTNSLVDEVMLKPVDVKPLQVRLKKNFMGTVPDYRIRHSRFARMQQRIAEQDILIGELISTLTSALEGWLIHQQKKTAPLGATTLVKVNDQTVYTYLAKLRQNYCAILALTLTH